MFNFGLSLTFLIISFIFEVGFIILLLEGMKLWKFKDTKSLFLFIGMILMSFLLDVYDPNPERISKLLDKFVFDFLVMAKMFCPRFNHQIFLLNVLLRWNGLSIHGRELMLSTGLSISKSTFYYKLQTLMPMVHESNWEAIGSSPFAIWIDNFTKVFSKDYKFYEGDRAFKVNDFTVCGAFLGHKKDTPPSQRNSWSIYPYDDKIRPVTTQAIFTYKNVMLHLFRQHNSSPRRNIHWESTSGLCPNFQIGMSFWKRI